MASDKAEYEVQVTTGNFLGTGTFDKVYITLTGKKGDKIIKIPRTRVSFSESVTVHADEDLGDFLMITLEKEARFILPESGWYCEYVKVSNVKTGKEHVFAVFSWVLRNKPVSVIESSARKSFEGTKELEELQAQQQLRQGVVQEIREGLLEALQNINLAF
ncbi:arachidonate 12-lipoxygenase, 12R-type-like [Protopterus annectens]|uniref:arachidonate 12-lipoxygenase, 12R-type-like n=1 Tax=Protopterus annectens TaxID=7888 RepID=UPI001CF9EC35|nr:arachidonate 12-lipoxygenase, 12R-type-like [Protopterus annectens]